MNIKRLPQRILSVTLLVLLLSANSRIEAQPASGDWRVPTDFGQCVFTVNSVGTHITKLIITFSNWRCGSVTQNGTVTFMSSPGWPISNLQFSITRSIDPSGNISMTVSGTFVQSGDQASGTWSARVYGTTCSGSWGPVFPVPIQLMSFTATSLGTQGVRLDWRTATETNNYGFEILRRRDAEAEFSLLPGVFIPGHGTTIEPHDYTYTDATATPGVWWYRLRQIDLDGTMHLLDPVLINLTTGIEEELVPQEYALQQNYPNPFNPTTTINYQLPMSSHVTLKVFDILGREVATLVDEVQEVGYRSVQFDASNLPAGRQGLASGVYLYRLQASNSIETKKCLVLR